MEKKVVYGIIVTYNAMQWIDNCLRSLQESIVPVVPIVVDNCSSDETLNHIRSYYPSTIIIANDVNKGFGQANNQGIEYAYKKGCKYFLLLNQDAFIYPDTVGFLLQSIDDYHLSVASPIHLNSDGSRLDGGFFDSSVLSCKNVRFVSDLFLNRLRPYYEVGFVNAAAWMISRECIEQVGGFDPVFFHYGEDVNYCQRLLYHNKNIGIVPASIIHHCRKDDSAGNPAVYNDRAYTMSLLIRVANINIDSGFYTRIKLSIQIKNLFSLMCRGRFKEGKRMIKSLMGVLHQKKQILESIKRNRQVYHNWLSL